MEIIDLSKPVDQGTRPFHEAVTGYSDPAFAARVWVDIGAEVAPGHASEYLVHALQLGTHVGTHVDTPAHFVEGAAALDGLEPDRLVGWGAVLDLRAETRMDPCIGPALVPRLASFGAALGPEQIPLIVTVEGAYLSAEATRTLAAWPGRLIAFADECAIDGPEDTGRAHYPNTRWLLEAGKFLAVELWHAERAHSDDLLVVAPLALRGLEAAPCRALAIRGLRHTRGAEVCDE
jgi:kynurenine formamidase